MKIPNIEFPSDFASIWSRVESIDPVKYVKTRNFIWGSVTYLSPYISRGVISVEDVRRVVLSKVDSPWQIEKFLQELAWREYWQRIWLQQADGIFKQIRRNQERRNFKFEDFEIPESIAESATNISALDVSINQLKRSGYMHNHLRMYLASIWCNVGGYSWISGAKWLHYYLLDGDLASNWLSWQWVCGTNSSKLYYCNQENINKYCNTQDSGTFLDFPYEYISREPMVVPDCLMNSTKFNYPLDPDFGSVSVMRNARDLTISGDRKIFIYHWYHLDPRWLKDEEGERIFLIEPSFFRKFPVSEVVMKFVLSLALEIPKVTILYTEFTDLKNQFPSNSMITREHPLVGNWEISFTPRIWMSSNEGAQGSFFNYWKNASKEVMRPAAED